MDVISDRVVEQLAQKFNFPTSAQVTPSPATTHPLIGIGGALGVTTPPAVASIPNPTIGVVGSTQSGQTEPPMIGVVEASQTTAANSAVMALLGESQRSLPLSSPLGLHVSPQIRDRIHNGQFIELPLLLPEYAPIDTGFPNDGARKQRSLPQLTIAEFASAFHAYIAIRAEHHPSDSICMLKYLETVHKINTLFGQEAWRFYDRSFRLALHHKVQEDWGQLNMELYMQATAIGLKAAVPTRSPQSTATNGSQRTSRFRPNTCWPFQEHSVCDNPSCRFGDTHSCYKCGGPHATFQCTRRGQSQPFRGRGATQRGKP